MIPATFANAESITNFSSDITVKKDGTVLVTEVISYDFGEVERHGIFRTLQNNHPQVASAWYKKRLIDIDLLSVSKDGADVPYTVSETSDATTIKIGDPNITITGEHAYTISYLLSGALSYGTEGAEFYYDATGNKWQVPMQRVSVVVRGEGEGMFADKQYCYRGVEGSTDVCEHMLSATEATFTAGALQAFEGLTVAQSVKPETVAVLIHEELAIGWVGYVAGFVWLLFISVWSYRFHTEHKDNKPVVAQYEPYEGVLPMYAGVLLDNTLDPHDITAGIVYLAEQGILKIKRTEEKVLWVFNTTDYELTLLKPYVEAKVPMLQSVLTLLFGAETKEGSVVRISELAKEKTQNAALIQKLRSDVIEELKKDGLLVTESFTSLPWKRIGIVIAVFVWAALYVNPVFVFIVLFLSGLVYGISFIKRRTRKGYEAVNHTKGFKLFLSVTEKERYTFFNAPEKNPELFMQFLPYAIAFKVEKEWAEAFKDITIPTPTWYEGGSMQTFSAVTLSQDIGAFSSSFASSSGTQGSSGGGSSGGGGGGGGGGSW